MVVIIYGIMGSLIAGLLIAYAIDKTWRTKVNRFLLIIWLNVKSIYMRIFSKTHTTCSDRIATCILGDPVSETGRDGIILIDFKGDGSTVKEIVEKELVRRTDNKNNNLYFYFAFTEGTVERFRLRPIVILVEYLDRDQGDGGSTKDDARRGLSLLYDGLGTDFESSFKIAGAAAFTEINGSWKWAGFNITDGHFHRRQNKVGDFRVGCRYANPKRDYELYLRRVMVIAL